MAAASPTAPVSRWRELAALVLLAVLAVMVVGPDQLRPGAAAFGEPTRDLFDHLALLDAWFVQTTDWNFPDGGSLIPPDLFGMLLASPFLGWGRGTAYNIAVTAQLTFACWGAWALCRRHGSGLVGGIVFGLCPYLVGQAGSGEAETLSAWPLPLVLLGLDREDRPGAVLAGVAAAAAAVGSWYHGAFAGVVMLGWLLVRGRPGTAKGTAGAALAPLVFGALIAIPAAIYASSLVSTDQLYRGPTMATYLLEQPRALAAMSADVLGWVGRAPAGANHVDNLGGLVPVLALAGLMSLRRVDRARARMLGGLVVFALVLSLGPVLHVGGEAVFSWMPGRVLSVLPGLGLMRLPHRWMVVVMLPLAVLVARVGRHSPLLVSGLLVAELFWFTGPARSLVSVDPPLIHTAIRGPVLDLPVRTLGVDARGRFLLWQRTHGHPTPYSLLMTAWSPTLAQEPLFVAAAAVDPANSLPLRVVEARQFRQEDFAKAVRAARRDDLEALRPLLDGAPERLRGLGLTEVVLHLELCEGGADPLSALLVDTLGEPDLRTDGALLWHL